MATERFSPFDPEQSPDKKPQAGREKLPDPRDPEHLPLSPVEEAVVLAYLKDNPEDARALLVRINAERAGKAPAPEEDHTIELEPISTPPMNVEDPQPAPSVQAESVPSTMEKDPGAWIEKLAIQNETFARFLKDEVAKDAGSSIEGVLLAQKKPEDIDTLEMMAGEVARELSELLKEIDSADLEKVNMPKSKEREGLIESISGFSRTDYEYFAFLKNEGEKRVFDFAPGRKGDTEDLADDFGNHRMQSSIIQELNIRLEAKGITIKVLDAVMPRGPYIMTVMDAVEKRSDNTARGVAQVKSWAILDTATGKLALNAKGESVRAEVVTA